MIKRTDKRWRHLYLVDWRWFRVYWRGGYSLVEVMIGNRGRDLGLHFWNGDGSLVRVRRYWR
jgi:hypothetical protein